MLFQEIEDLQNRFNGSLEAVKASAMQAMADHAAVGAVLNPPRRFAPPAASAPSPPPASRGVVSFLGNALRELGKVGLYALLTFLAVKAYPSATGTVAPPKADPPPAAVKPAPAPAPDPTPPTGQVVEDVTAVLVLPANPSPDQVALKLPNGVIEKAMARYGAGYVVRPIDAPEVSTPGFRALLAQHGPPPVLFVFSTDYTLLASGRVATGPEVEALMKKARSQ